MRIETKTSRKPSIKAPDLIKVDPEDENLYRDLIESAKTASRSAYQPYSQYSVGAAVLGFDGSIYSGFNIENCGYSQCIHAEEAAVTNALANGLLARAMSSGLSRFEAILAIAVYAPKGTDPWPCCNCRQFLGEFGYDMHIIGEDPQTKEILCLTLAQLVPHAFPIEIVLESVRAGRS